MKNPSKESLHNTYIVAAKAQQHQNIDRMLRGESPNPKHYVVCEDLDAVISRLGKDTVLNLLRYYTERSIESECEILFFDDPENNGEPGSNSEAAGYLLHGIFTGKISPNSEPLRRALRQGNSEA